MILPRNVPIQKPIFIIGAPRSGTSFLSNVMEQHRSTALLTEPRLTWRYGNDGKSDMLRPSDARPDVRDHVRSTFEQFVREQGKARLVEKTPSNALRMPFVNEIFPDGLFVHILRHGIDSALSIRNFWQQYASGVNPARFRKGVIRQRMGELSWRRVPYYSAELLRRIAPKRLTRVFGPSVWGPRIPGLGGLTRDLQPLEVSSLQWRMCVESACLFGRTLPKHRYMECRLEDMSADLIRRILDFCELDEDSSVTGYLNRLFDPDRSSARSARCDHGDRQTILQWIEPTLSWLGYECHSGPPLATIGG